MITNHTLHYVCSFLLKIEVPITFISNIYTISTISFAESDISLKITAFCSGNQKRLTESEEISCNVHSNLKAGVNVLSVGALAFLTKGPIMVVLGEIIWVNP